MERRISANPEERAALARRFGLIGIDRLEAVFALKRAGGGVIHVTGEIEAEVTQSCVITLAPVQAKVGRRFPPISPMRKIGGGRTIPTSISRRTTPGTDPERTYRSRGIGRGTPVFGPGSLSQGPGRRGSGAVQSSPGRGRGNGAPR